MFSRRALTTYLAAVVIVMAALTGIRWLIAGAAGAGQRHRLACHPPQRILYSPLDRTCVVLALPAMIDRAIIFNDKFKIPQLS